eukprot:25770-Eustigmatos_ZCMA.PRE.1
MQVVKAMTSMAHVRCTAITGLQGIGKTALASAVCQYSVSAYRRKSSHSVAMLVVRLIHGYTRHDRADGSISTGGQSQAQTCPVR